MMWFIFCRLTALVEAGVLQNASIDIHEDYFEYEDTSVDFTEYSMRYKTIGVCKYAYSHQIQ